MKYKVGDVCQGARSKRIFIILKKFKNNVDYFVPYLDNLRTLYVHDEDVEDYL